MIELGRVQHFFPFCSHLVLRAQVLRSGISSHLCSQEEHTFLSASDSSAGGTLPHTSPIFFSVFWYKETAHHLFYKVGSVRPTSVDLSKPRIILFGPPPMPLIMSFLKTKQNLCNYMAICAFQGIFCKHYSSLSSQNLLQQVWQYYPPFYRYNKSTDLCGDSPWLPEQSQNEADSLPRSLTWGEYSLEATSLSRRQ